MMNKHIIHKLTFEIEGFETNSQYQRFANKISSLSRTSLSSRINNLLSKYSIPGYHIVIHSLEIDLEYINMHNLENNLLMSLEILLNRKLRKINNEARYKIKHGEISSIFSVTKNELAFQDILQKKQASLSSNLEISKDVSNYFNAISHNKVIPANARYVEAILYYLEYGWLPKHLEIPYEEFDVKFAESIKEYKEEIIKHFGRKSSELKEKIYNRVFSQISIPKLQESHQLKESLKKPLLAEIFQDKLQLMINYLDKQKKSRTLSDSDKERTRKILTELYDYGKSLQDIESIKKLLQPYEESDTEKEFKHIDTFRETDRQKFIKKVDKLLYADKVEFESLLETPFYKSIVTSYSNITDSSELLTRSIIPLILKPEKKQEIYDHLPEHIDDEKEILNQMYQRTPSLIPSILKNLQKLESKPNILKQNLISFLQSLQKKHIDYILKASVSNYTRYSPVLNESNYNIKKHKNLTNKFYLNTTEPIDEHKFLQINIIVEKIIENKTFETVIKKVLSTIAESKVSEKYTKQDIESKLKFIKERKYKDSEELYSIAVDNFIHDFSSKVDDREIIKSQFKTLMNEFYLPAAQKQITPPSISKFISKLEKETKASGKKELEEILRGSQVLKNIVLRKLSVADFSALIQVILPTAKAREFLSLIAKYDFIWKNMIDIQQVQLIFLSLIKKQKEINTNTIFRYFFDELRTYKGWTADVQKKRLIDNFELHREKLSEGERTLILNYIDKIPTMQSLLYKDTRKKLEDGIPVKNAGLVLIWPFLKTLFGIADFLTPKGDFKNAELKERAVLMLQYIAVKSTTIEEPYLALNKILVGMPLEDSLPKEITLTQKEKDIADALLLNVLKQWPSFTNSSVDNLRGSFLIRDGILAFRGTQWVLRVENKAYDLLLNKLPWGISLIRLSWLPYMIKVEWN